MTRTVHHLRLVASAPEPSPPDRLAPASSDASLIAGLERREPTASLAFYERARPILDRTLSRLLGGRDPDYEDVAQAALYELVDSIGRFRGECPLDAWLSVVCARVAYRQIRRRRLERRFFAPTAPDESIQGIYAPPTPFASRQAVERIRAHLGQMDQKRTWTFLLHDVYGYGLEEVSQIMDTTASAAQSRLVRGRREIHDRIRVDPGLYRFLEDLCEDVP